MGILDGMRPEYRTVQSTGTPIGNYTDLQRRGVNTYSFLDTGLMAGNAAARYQGAGDDAAGAAITAAQGGVSAADNAARRANASISNINQYAGQAAQSAAGIGGAITNVNNSADSVRSLAGSLTPYAQQLSAQGSQIYGQGTNLVGQGQGYLDNAGNIMSMNKDAGGLVGQYVQALMAINPDRYVSASAADTNSAFNNAAGQMERNLSRSGVSAGSGRSVALAQQLAQAHAAALAGSKTRARQTGINERFSALGSGLNTAQGQAGIGGSLMSQGINAEATGSSVTNSAAGIVANQGSLEASAGNLNATAGQLGASQANAYTNAGQLTQAAGSLGLNAASTQVSAANALANAQASAAQYYASVGQGYAQIAGSGNLMSSLF